MSVIYKSIINYLRSNLCHIKITRRYSNIYHAISYGIIISEMRFDQDKIIIWNRNSVVLLKYDDHLLMEKLISCICNMNNELIAENTLKSVPSKDCNTYISSLNTAFKT